MKLFLILSDEVKQRYLIRQLGRSNDIRSIVFENRYTFFFRTASFIRSNSYNPIQILKSLFQKFQIRRYERSNPEIIKSYFCENGSEIPISEKVPVFFLKEINFVKTLDLIARANPELVIVFGASMIKKDILAGINCPVINVHTGLSPYYRGGQSAFWALYNNEPEYIGVTVHYISAGIDSGDIILQGRPTLDKGDNLCSIECKLALLAVKLLLRVISDMEGGRQKRVKQLSKGRLFLSKMFTLEKRLDLYRRMDECSMQKVCADIKKVNIVDDKYDKEGI